MRKALGMDPIWLRSASGQLGHSRIRPDKALTTGSGSIIRHANARILFSQKQVKKLEESRASPEMTAFWKDLVKEARNDRNYAIREHEKTQKPTAEDRKQKKKSKADRKRRKRKHSHGPISKLPPFAQQAHEPDAIFFGSLVHKSSKKHQKMGPITPEDENRIRLFEAWLRSTDEHQSSPLSKKMQKSAGSRRCSPDSSTSSTESSGMGSHSRRPCPHYTDLHSDITSSFQAFSFPPKPSFDTRSTASSRPESDRESPRRPRPSPMLLDPEEPPSLSMRGVGSSRGHWGEQEAPSNPGRMPRAIDDFLGRRRPHSDAARQSIFVTEPMKPEGASNRGRMSTAMDDFLGRPRPRPNIPRQPLFINDHVRPEVAFNRDHPKMKIPARPKPQTPTLTEPRKFKTWEEIEGWPPSQRRESRVSPRSESWNAAGSANTTASSADDHHPQKVSE